MGREGAVTVRSMPYQRAQAGAEAKTPACLACADARTYAAATPHERPEQTSAAAFAAYATEDPT